MKRKGLIGALLIIGLLFWLLPLSSPRHEETPHLSYDDEGKLAVQGYYKDGKQDGIWTFYWTNGRKRSEGNYVHGMKDGLWTWYDSLGGKRKRERWERGSLAAEIDCRKSPDDCRY